MNNNQQQLPEENKGASPVSHVPNGDPGDRGVLNDKKSETVSGKEDQHQTADRNVHSQDNDEEDRFDLDSLKGKVQNDRKGEADDAK